MKFFRKKRSDEFLNGQSAKYILIQLPIYSIWIVETIILNQTHVR